MGHKQISERFRQILWLCNSMSDGGEKISHAHVLVRVCKRINACMNLSVHACACPFLTRPVLHFKICVANDPRLTRSPAEHGRVGEGGLSLRARQCRSECLAVCTYVKHAWGRACVWALALCLYSLRARRFWFMRAHTCRRSPRRVSGSDPRGKRAAVRQECLRDASGRGGGGGSGESGGK